MLRYIDLETRYQPTLQRLINLLEAEEDMDLLEHVLKSDSVPQEDWRDLVELALFKLFK